ncbi:class I SAM-dependent methyltransferase [Candidatus Bipolaricaulota bacterium]|nr:class I SAM-dependent methyltransferase [Candidatus Bipolaricaulota bacterium]
MGLFERLEDINVRPEPFERYTAAELWTDDHISEQMLAYHLNTDLDVASRRGSFIDQSVGWICSKFNVGVGTRIADFGCGPGLYVNRLAKLGASVVGIDFSSRSIEYARTVAAKEGLTASYVNENYLEFETTDCFELILMIMCDFCSLSPAQRAALLRKFGALLAPGGAILLDVYSMNALKQREESVSYEFNQANGFWSPGKNHVFRSTHKYEDVGVVLDKYTIVEAKRTRTIYNWTQHFLPEALHREFGNAGFTQQELYGNVTGAPFDSRACEFAVVATRSR